MNEWNVLSNEEVERRLPVSPSPLQNQLAPYQLESKRWVFTINQDVMAFDDNDIIAKQSVIDAITSPHVCMVIVAVVSKNITTLNAFYSGTETLSEEDVAGAIIAHCLHLPIQAPFHVPGHRMKLLTHELNFVPLTAVGVLVVHRSHMTSFGNVGHKAWLRMLEQM